MFCYAVGGWKMRSEAVLPRPDWYRCSNVVSSPKRDLTCKSGDRSCERDLHVRERAPEIFSVTEGDRKKAQRHKDTDPTENVTTCSPALRGEKRGEEERRATHFLKAKTHHIYHRTALSTWPMLSATIDHSKESKMECTSEASDDAVAFCPLFMDGLPSDFSTNPALAALASLLEVEDDDNDPAASSSCDKPAELAPPPTNEGGGKVKRVKSRSGRQSAPYPKRTQKKDGDNKKTATAVAEASLFLKLWKL